MATALALKDETQCLEGSDSTGSIYTPAPSSIRQLWPPFYLSVMLNSSTADQGVVLKVTVEV